MGHNYGFCTASVCCILQGRTAVFEQATDRMEKMQQHSHPTENESSSDVDAHRHRDYRIFVDFNSFLDAQDPQRVGAAFLMILEMCEM